MAQKGYGFNARFPGLFVEERVSVSRSALPFKKTVKGFQPDPV
jgi:hypothetical protein